MIGIEPNHRSRVADRYVLGPSTENLYEIGTFLNDEALDLPPSSDRLRTKSISLASPLPGLAKASRSPLAALTTAGIL